jgi:hypothetical protein
MTDPATGLPQPAADEALLERLAEALRPEPRTPPPASVAALRRTVAQRWRPTVWARLMRRLLAWARRLQRTGAAVAVFGGLAVGGSGMALAAGGSMHQTTPYRPHNLGTPRMAPAGPTPGRTGHDPCAGSAASETSRSPTPRYQTAGLGGDLSDDHRSCPARKQCLGGRRVDAAVLAGAGDLP